MLIFRDFCVTSHYDTRNPPHFLSVAKSMMLKFSLTLLVEEQHLCDISFKY